MNHDSYNTKANERRIDQATVKLAKLITYQDKTHPHTAMLNGMFSAVNLVNTDLKFGWIEDEGINEVNDWIALLQTTINNDNEFDNSLMLQAIKLGKTVVESLNELIHENEGGQDA